MNISNSVRVLKAAVDLSFDAMVADPKSAAKLAPLVEAIALPEGCPDALDRGVADLVGVVAKLVSVIGLLPSALPH
jgi:hypothetical protein